MKTKSNLFAAAILALASFNLQLATSQAQTTAFTFQGQLNNGAGNANGSYDMKFAVWSAAVSGNQIAGPVTNSTVAVSNGLFTVSLDFGAGIFTGTNYFVEMGVRTNGGAGFATLAPRQQLTPAPAAFSLSAQSPQFNSFCPVGSVIAFAGVTAPAGWTNCNGNAVSRTTYSNLFAVVGTTYGAGDGSTTFNLPDMRGRTGIGAGQGGALSNRNLGETPGEETHTLSILEMPNHSHNVHDNGHSHPQVVTANSGGPSQRLDYRQDGPGQIYPQGVNTGTGFAAISETAVGGSQPHNVMQPSLVLNYIIKY